jgi:MFS family permease
MTSIKQSSGDNSMIMYAKVALLALPWLSIQTIWNTQFAAVGNTMQTFGFSPQLSRLVWLSGPLSGFFTAPIVGAYSDACTSKYGRRRPFIVGGLLLTIVFAMLFAYSKEFGDASWFVGLLASVLLDITINVIQTPVRALGSDMAPADMQATVQLLAAFFQGAGGIIASLLSKWFYFGKVEDLPIVFAVVMGLNVVVIGLVCVVVKETPYEGQEEKLEIFGPLVTVIKSVGGMDVRLFTVCMCNFFSWAGLFVWWPNAANWWGVYVYDGCVFVEGSDDCIKGGPENKRFSEGTTAYGDSGIFANLLQTIFCVILSLLVLRGILRRVKYIYSFALLTGAVFLILVKVIPGSIPFAYMVAITIAIPISAIQSFPFAIVGSYNVAKKGMDTGVQFGILNLFITTPQVIVTIAISGFADFEWAMFAAGCCFGVAGLIALFIYEVPSDVLQQQIEDMEKK